MGPSPKGLKSGLGLKPFIDELQALFFTIYVYNNFCISMNKRWGINDSNRA